MDFNFQPIVQQYTPSPVAEFDAFGKQLKERYKTNMAEWDKLDVFSSQLETLEGSKQIKDKALGEMRELIKNYQDKGNWEDAAPKIRLAAKRLAKDTNLNTAVQNFANAKKWDEETRQMVAKGQQVIRFKDYKTEQFDEAGNLLSNTSRYDTQERLDPSIQYEKFFDKITPDSISESIAGWGQGGKGLYESFQSSKQAQAITRERIEQAVDANIDRVISSTNEGAQRYRYLTEQGNLTAEQARETMRQEAIGVGSERIFQQIATTKSTAPISNPYDDAKLKKLQIANASMDLFTKKRALQAQEEQGNVFGAAVQSVKTARDQVNLGTKQQFNESVKTAFSGDGSREKEFLYSLQNLSKSEDKKVAKSAKDYLGFVTQMQKAYPNSYKQKIVALEESGNSINDVLGRIKKEGKFVATAGSYQSVLQSFIPEKDKGKENSNGIGFITKYANMRKENRTSNSNFLFDSNFENAWQGLNRSYETIYKAPSANSLAKDVTLNKAWDNLTKDPIIKNEWELLKSDDNPKGGSIDKVSGDLKIRSYSEGSGGPGLGTTYMAYDKDGKSYILRPKESTVTNDFSEVLKRPSMAIANDLSREGGVATELILNSVKANINNVDKSTNSFLLKDLAPFLLESLDKRGDIELIERLMTKEGSSAVNVKELEKLVNEYKMKF